MLLTPPLLLARRSWAQNSAPNARLNVAVIGIGMIGRVLLNTAVARDDVQVVAVCDVDTTRREAARQRVDEAYSKKHDGSYRGCAGENDFRAILARPDIDAVIIAVPDHWHATMAIAAVRAGKDVYCEKPLTHTIDEALRLVQAVRQTNRVLQTGSQQRSSKEFRVAAELVRNGVIGRVNSIHVSFGDPAGPCDFPAEPIEHGLDWNLWCGPAPLVGYNPALSPRGVHTQFPPWRQTWEFGGGAITNWGAHHIDIVQWALGVDGSGPVEVRAPKNWETAKRGAQLVYADGTLLTHVRGRAAVTFHGTEGQIEVDRGKFELTLAGKTMRRFWDKQVDKATSLEREVTLTEREFLSDAKVKLYRSPSHFQDFVDCVRSRQKPICDVEIGASTVIACHLMNFGYRYGANVRWDPARHQFTRGGNPKWLTRTDRNWQV